MFSYLKSLFIRKQTPPELPPAQEFTGELKEFFKHFNIRTDNPHLYKLALTHGSFSEDSSDNERLEFMGDAVLGLIITEELFRTFPHHDEGKMTKLRSKIVGRQSMNKLGISLGLNKFIYHRLGKNGDIHDSNHVGNALEALIGAMYLDKGYKYTQVYVRENVVKPYIDLHDLHETVLDHKSMLIIWAQKNKKNYQFNLVTVFSDEETVRFKVAFTIDDKVVATGIGKSKKKAEQEASKRAIEKLDIQM